MDRCPVCGKENDQPVCKSCGFDGSRDYERHPTLAGLNGTIDAVSRRKSARQAPSPQKEQKQAEKKEKHMRPKGVTFMLWLGWLYLLFQMLYLQETDDQIFILMDDPVMKTLRHVLVISSVLMQLRLCVKNFEPSGNKLILGIDRTLIFICPFALLFLVPMVLLTFGDIPSLIYHIMAVVYYGLYYVGMKTVTFAPLPKKKTRRSKKGKTEQ